MPGMRDLNYLINLQLAHMYTFMHTCMMRMKIWELYR